MPMLNEEQKRFLLQAARQSIASYFRTGQPLIATTDDPLLQEKRGSFVSLHQNGGLRGCIGLLEPLYPLVEAVCRLAVEAAVADPRFLPLSPTELPLVKIEISVLTPPRKVSGPDEILLGRDGVIVQRGWQKGVFLPQVAAETGWDKETFLSVLCRDKAGLPPDAWKDKETELYTFQAEVFAESND